MADLIFMYTYRANIGLLSKRASSFGFPGVTVNGEDVMEVYRETEKAVARARNGKGPTLVEAKTMRWGGHYEGDPQKYKSAAELENPQSFDPVSFFEKNYSADYGISASDIRTTYARTEKIIKDASINK